MLWSAGNSIMYMGVQLMVKQSLSVHISLSAGKKAWKVVLGVIRDLKLIMANMQVHYTM